MLRGQLIIGCSLSCSCGCRIPNDIFRGFAQPGGDLSPNYDFIAQRNLAERARLLVLHSSDDGRIGPGAISR